VRRENSQNAGADEIEREIHPRLGGAPSALRRYERSEDEQRPEHLDDLVHRNLLVAPSSGRVRRELSSGRSYCGDRTARIAMPDLTSAALLTPATGIEWPPRRSAPCHARRQRLCLVISVTAGRPWQQRALPAILVLR
jgi:hypothetical protein